MKLNFTNITILFPLLMVSACAHRQTLQTNEQKASAIRTILSTYAHNGQFNGSALVADKNGVVYQGAFGMANFEWKVPNDLDTQFRLGSLTKQFTAALIVKLASDGMLSLDGKISEYLPYYRKDIGDKVTIRELLNHTSGIPNYTEFPDYMSFSREHFDHKTFVEKYCSRDLSFEPGTRFHYSNSNYYILGAIVEQITKRPYCDVLSERVLAPAHMTHTACDTNELVLDKRAEGYEPAFGENHQATYVDMSLPFAAGQLHSTVGDLYQWSRALDSDAVLTEREKQEAMTPGKGDYGFGWRIHKIPATEPGAGATIEEHGGSINGYFTLLQRIEPDHNLIVLLNNTDFQPLDRIAADLRSVLFGHAVPPPKPSAARVLEDAITRVGAAAAAKHVEMLHNSSDEDRYDWSEAELNQLGYKLMRAHRASDAVSVLALTAHLYPASWNAYDSLAEGCLAAGDFAGSMRNYRKSLEINPKNDNARRMIEKLEADTDGHH